MTLDGTVKELEIPEPSSEEGDINYISQLSVYIPEGHLHKTLYKVAQDAELTLDEQALFLKLHRPSALRRDQQLPDKITECIKDMQTLGTIKQTSETLAAKLLSTLKQSLIISHFDKAELCRMVEGIRDHVRRTRKQTAAGNDNMQDTDEDHPSSEEKPKASAPARSMLSLSDRVTAPQPVATLPPPPPVIEQPAIPQPVVEKAVDEMKPSDLTDAATPQELSREQRVMIAIAEQLLPSMPFQIFSALFADPQKLEQVAAERNLDAGTVSWIFDNAVASIRAGWEPLKTSLDATVQSLPGMAPR